MEASTNAQASIHLIEINDFKSYRGKISVGPINSFTSVMGPNGCGKSNLMDAILFGVGEKITELRVARSKDLVYGSIYERPVAKQTSVEVVFRLNDGSFQSFKRIARQHSNMYEIDGKRVLHPDYLEALKKIGINVKAKNFLAFQGKIESLAELNPKELTAVFEEISGSAECKEKYEDLKARVQEMENEVKSIFSKQKSTIVKKNFKKLEKDAVAKYTKLKKDLDNKCVEHALFTLYHIQRNIEGLEEERKSKESELSLCKAQKNTAIELLKKTKKKKRQCNQPLENLEKEISQMESTIKMSLTALVVSKEKLAQLKRRLDNAQKSLQAAQVAREAHDQVTKVLREELQTSEVRQKEFEERLVAESEDHGRNAQLDDSQMAEYYALKAESSKRCAQITPQFDPLNRRWESCKDKLDSENRIKSALELEIQLKESQRNNALERSEKLSRHIREAEKDLNEQRNRRELLASNQDILEECIVNLQAEVRQITEELVDADINNHERNKERARTALKEQIAGVVDRLAILCTPVHTKYHVALTKIMGNNADAIVVDSMETAKQCIEYLKANMLGREKFLPLDYIQAKALPQSLHSIPQHPNAHLLYDVVKFDPCYDKAVRFATSTTIVCNTMDEAEELMLELRSQRVDTVSLDGTVFRWSGNISGGLYDLQKKAQKLWSEKTLVEKEARQEVVKVDLRAKLTQSRKEKSEMNLLETQVQALQTRFNIIKADYDNTQKLVTTLDTEIENKKRQLNECENRIGPIQETMNRRDGNLRLMREELQSIDDNIFKDFCDQVGVENIRQYEEDNLRASQNRAEQRNQLEAHKNRVIAQLDFELSRDTDENIRRFRKVTEECKNELKLAKSDELKQKEVTERQRETLKDLKAKHLSKIQEIKTEESILKKVEDEIKMLNAKLQVAENQLTTVTGKIYTIKYTRHSLLTQSKIKNITIPIVGDSDESEDTITTISSDDISDPSISQTIFDRESKISFDYSSISDELKSLNINEVENKDCELMSAVDKLSKQVESFEHLNLQASEDLHDANQTLHELTEQLSEARRSAKNAKKEFETVKRDRHERFMKCYDVVFNSIDGVYKMMTKSTSGMAMLTADNVEEPYLGGINYCCIVPGKSCQAMKNLSGGERTLAAITLLMALQMHQQPPFVIMDEIDAALDNSNVRLVAQYFRQKSSSCPIILITLKELMYAQSDALIGVTSVKRGPHVQSQIFSLDLTPYPLV